VPREAQSLVARVVRHLGHAQARPGARDDGVDSGVEAKARAGALGFLAQQVL